MSLNSIYTNPLLWVNQGFEWRHVNCLSVSGIDTYWVFSAAGILCDSNADREYSLDIRDCHQPKFHAQLLIGCWLRRR